jgi:ParB-like chromosome segregation protein Spo0J
MTHENESAPAVAAAQGAQDDRSGDAISIQDSGTGAPAQLEFHPLADAFPLLQGKEFEELVDDIKACGQREPIVLHEDKILDGRNRYLACRALGIEPLIVAFESIAAPDDTPEAYVISVNAHRRHLTPEQKQAVLIKLRVANPEKSDRQLAAEAGVAHTP